MPCLKSASDIEAYKSAGQLCRGPYRDSCTHLQFRHGNRFAKYVGAKLVASNSDDVVSERISAFHYLKTYLMMSMKRSLSSTSPRSSNCWHR